MNEDKNLFFAEVCWPVSSLQRKTFHDWHSREVPISKPDLSDQKFVSGQEFLPFLLLKLFKFLHIFILIIYLL